MSVPIKPNTTPSTPSFVKRFLATYSSLTLVVLVFAFGFIVGQFSPDTLSGAGEDSTGNGEVQNTDTPLPDYLANDIDFQQFWDVWSYVKQNYVHDDVADTQLFYGALQGLVSSLDDPYSVFFDPEITNQFEEELSGSFEGIGAEIGLRDNQLTIIAPLANTPAQRSGLLAGDAILMIDSEDTFGVPLDQAVSMIRGEKGSTVVLTVFTEGDDEPHDVSIVRDTITIDSVRVSDSNNGGSIGDDSFKLEDGGIAYIQLLYFNENTLADWNQTVQEMLKLNPKGIVLDLRNNPGGFLSTAIDVAAEWVNGQVVVKERLRDGVEIAHTSDRLPRFAGIPTVVLVNGGSASGAEIVAGALQDYDVATIVGEQTFGKGSVQDLKRFGDGSSVKLTIAEWFTPLGKNINEQGITPDEVVELTRENFEAEEDPQLDRAFELLHSSQ